uniref:Uncharacterized protein n=1 Tax=Desulfomonile tiedjei TaxID=2358 RepID=A0A7C4AR23_9BACT
MGFVQERNGSHFIHSMEIGSNIWTRSLAADVFDVAYTREPRRIRQLIACALHHNSSYAVMVVSKAPATGPIGPSDTLRSPAHSRKGMSRIAAHRPAHPRTGLLGAHRAMRNGAGAGAQAMGGGATVIAACGFTFVIGLGGGDAHTGGAQTGAGAHIGGAQNARRRGNTGGGGSRIADAKAAGQPSTVPHTREQRRSTPLHNAKGRGPHAGTPHTGGAH